MTQSNPKDPNDKEVVKYISRMLTESEINYSQLEKEALNIPWALEHLDIYLLGRKFVIYTDNRAVALIFNNPLANPPAVIRRWRLRVSSFNFEVVHRAGLGNIADFLSRHPLKERILSKHEDDTKEYVNMMVTYSKPCRIKRDTILKEIILISMCKNL